MKKRKFGDGGEIPPGGRFDADTYRRARAWLAAGSPERDPAEYDVGKKSASRAASTPAPTRRAAPSPAPSPAPTPSPPPPTAPAGRAEIPGAGPYVAPQASGRMPGEVERNVRNIASALTGLARVPSVASAASKTAAPAASRVPAISETPVTFLGASGRTSMAPRATIGTEAPRRLGMSPEAMRVANTPAPRQLPPASASATTPRALEAPSRTPGLLEQVTQKLQAVRNKSSRSRGSSRAAFEEATGTKKGAVPAKSTPSASGRGSSNARSRTRYNSDEKDVEFKSGGMVRGCGKATRTKKAKTY